MQITVNGEEYIWDLKTDSVQVRVLGKAPFTLHKDDVFAFPKRFERIVKAIVLNPNQNIFKRLKIEEE